MRAEQVDGTLRLADLYAPVAAHLRHAQRLFRDELLSDQSFINQLCRHIDRFHGKQLRPALLLLTAQACGGVRPEHPLLAAVVEMVHIATLVHDDVLDEGDVRRGTPTVNRLCGNERAVLLGDILFSHAYHLCSSLDSPDAARVIGQTAVTVCTGEMMQIVNRDNHELTEAEYLDIITRKTAALTGTCAWLGATYAAADEPTCRRMQEFGTSLGIAFQITDDLLDLTGDETIAGKSLGRDVQKGKLTLPLIHFLRHAEPARVSDMRGILHDDHPQRNRRIAWLLEGSESVAYAQQAAQTCVHSALEILSALPESEARSSLRAMAQFILARQY